MAYSITATEDFDHKRTKVTLDYGEVTFLLYKGECKRLKDKQELSEKEYQDILEAFGPLRSQIEEKAYRENGHVIVCYTKVMTEDRRFYRKLELRICREVFPDRYTILNSKEYRDEDLI